MHQCSIWLVTDAPAAPTRPSAASGSGDLWLSIGFGTDTAKNVRLRLDEDTGGVLLTGYTVAPDGSLTKTCGAMYSVRGGEGLVEKAAACCGLACAPHATPARPWQMQLQLSHARGSLARSRG